MVKMLMKTGREKQNSIRGSRGVCANGVGAIPVRCGTKRGISRMLSALLIAGVLGLMGPLMGSARAEARINADSWSYMVSGVGMVTSSSQHVYITVTSDLTISGGNAHNKGGTVVIDLNGHTIDGGGSQQAFWNESGTMTIKNGTIRNCRNDRGGAINNRGTLTLENVVISNCTGNIEAGGIMNYGTLTMTGGKITDCNASRGGALRVRPFGSGGSAIANSATATLTNVEISDNSCDGRRDSGDGQYGRGGAIAVTNGTLTMDGCTVSGNKSTDDDGGAIDFDSSGKTLTLTNSTFSNNQTTQSDRDGGAVNLERGEAVITGCTFTGNTAKGEGGAINISNSFGTATVSDTTITGNTSKDHSGGGIMNRATLTLKGTNTITDNTAKYQGGGLYFSYNGKILNIEGTLKISDNYLSSGRESNLFLGRNQRLNVIGNLTGEIGVTPEDLNITPTVITIGANGKADVSVFWNDDRFITELTGTNEIQMRLSAPLSGDVLNKVTVAFHPKDQHSGLCIKDNGYFLGQNVVWLYNLGDSFRFWLTKADDDSYYIDFFGGADDYDPSNKRLDLSDNGGYGTVGNVVHVVMGDKTAMNKRWRFYRNSDGTYYIQNKRSGLFWDLENDNFNDKNKLCQRQFVDAQKWQMEIVHADADSGATIDDQKRIKEVKQYDSFSFEYIDGTVMGNNWMSFLPDNEDITFLSIPGTHDAGTAHTTSEYNAMGQCQQLSIMDQLNCGIRYFDLRLGHDDNWFTDRNFQIVHNSVNCMYKGEYLRIKTVMKWINNFLDENPGETVILQVMPYKAFNEFHDIHQLVYEYFRDEVRNHPDRYYIGNHVPTLGEVRGKILIISRIENANNSDFNKKTASERYPDGMQWAIDAKRWLEWNDSYSDPLAKTAETDQYVIWTQDKFKTVGDDKWRIIMNSTFNPETGPLAKRSEAAAAGKHAWVISYSSCVRTYPQDSAQTLNPKLKKQLVTNEYAIRSVLCSDFTDQQLAYLVYRQNFWAGESDSEVAIAADVFANDRVYDGTEQPLVTVLGEPIGGTMQYAVGTDDETPPTEGWSTDIPSATDVGTYYVWYRVVGDEDHFDSVEVCVTVTISEEALGYMIYKVENPVHTIGDGLNTVIYVRRSELDSETYFRFTETLIDGAEIDPSHYSTAKGSLILTLKAAYLDTLTVGDHKLTIAFEDGSATATIKIKEAAPAPTATPKPVPKTGDGSNPALWLGLAVAGLILIAGTVILWNRKKRCGK